MQAAASLAALLCACGGGGGGGSSLPASGSTGSAVPNFSGVQLTIAPQLAMGAAGTYAVTVTALSGTTPVKGPLSVPITVSDNDTSGRTTLQGSSVTTSPQNVSLAYDGKAVRFAITATFASQQQVFDFVSTLPKDVGLTALSGLPDYRPQMYRIGSDGNVWSILQGPSFVAKMTVTRITPSGVATVYTNSNAREWNDPSRSVLALGSDGNMWTESHNSWTEGEDITRVTPTGAFANFATPLYAGDVVSTMIQGLDGAIWFGAAEGIYRCDTSGQITQIVAFPGTAYSLSGAPYSLVIGADKNYWFLLNGSLERLTPGGTLTSFALPPIGLSNVMFSGSDGNIWIPYPNRVPGLMRVSTTGTVISQTTVVDAYPGEPVLSDAGVDSSGNAYVTDQNRGLLIRFDASGNASQWPTYSSTFSNVTVPTTVAVAPVGTASVGDIMVVQNGDSAGAISTISPTDW